MSGHVALHAANGQLLAHGFCEFVVPEGHFVLEVADGFALAPRQWRWDGEAYVLFVPHANITIKAQLAQIDEQTLRVGVRGLRELVLGFSALIELLRANGFPQIPSTADNQGVINVGQIEAAAAALRAQLDPEGP